MSDKKHSAGEKPGEVTIPDSLSDLHCFTETSGVITTTMFDIPGYKVVKVLGTVYGITVRSRNWAAGLGMVIKSVVGGELKWFTSMVRLCFALLSPPLPPSPCPLDIENIGVPRININLRWPRRSIAAEISNANHLVRA
jgi:hypothetical protein